MTTPATNPGQTDNTPTAGGSASLPMSGAAGADQIEAPDNIYGSVHRPGQAPGVEIGEGPAVMKVGAKSKKNSKKKS